MTAPRRADSALEDVVVVTGASSGIGRSIASRALADGRSVVALSRRDPELADAVWRPCDLSEGSVDPSVLADVTSVGAIVHAAGFQESGRLGDLDPIAGSRMFAVHVTAAVSLVDRAMPLLRDGGRIVLIGSRTADGVAGKSLYSATKSALRGLARSWAVELAPRQITVNVVEPGPTRTAMLNDPRRGTTPVRLPPLGRLVEADEVADLVAFLLGPTGAMITGQQLQICGGASLG